MNRYWTRIALGALLIFCLGLAGIAAVNRGKAEVSRLLGSVGARIPLQLAHLGFGLDGRRIGDVSAIDIRHSTPGEIGRVTVQVALEGDGEVAGLRDCKITAGESWRWEGGGDFRCAQDEEMGRLIELGSVIFEPGTLTRPLYVPSEALDRWERAGIRSLDASLVTDGKGGVTAKGSYDLDSRRHGSERGSFTLTANQLGAALSVLDDRGRTLVDLKASERGMSLKLKDKARLLQLIDELKQ